MTGRAIVVNGPSLRTAKGRLGIGLINFAGLNRLLQQVGGNKRTTAKPIITMELPNNRLKSEMADAGFDVRVPKGRQNGQQLMAELVDEICCPSISELVVLGADSALFSTVCRKAKEGLGVFWVDTCSPKNFKCAGLPDADVSQLLESRIVYIDLAAHRREIAKEDTGQYVPIVEASSEDQRNMNAEIIFKGTNGRRAIEFATELHQLIARYPKEAKIKVS